MNPICILPGRADWEAFIGGDFFPSETDDLGSYRWIGEYPAWLYLPEIPADPALPLHIEIEAACNPWGAHPLLLLDVPVSGPGRPFRHAFCSSEPSFSGKDSKTAVLPHNPKGHAAFRYVTEPVLEILADEQPLRRLTFENRHGVQTFAWTAETSAVLSAKALHLRPNYAFSPVDFGHAEQRRLSFRINRVVLTQPSA